MVYLPAGAPNGDRDARTKLQWQNGPHPNREFQAMWEQVIREWSTRWGDKVTGWWFDGCYWPNTMYRGDEPPNFESFAAAARAGNPNSIVAFNPGVFLRVFSMSPHEDYTAGEINNVAGIEIRRQENGRLDGTQIHILSYLGERWGGGAAALRSRRRGGLEPQHLALRWCVHLGRANPIERHHRRAVHGTAQSHRRSGTRRSR